LPHYLGKLKIQILCRYSADVEENANRLHYECPVICLLSDEATDNIFLSLKNTKSVTDCEKFWSRSLALFMRAAPFASVSSCARRLLKHFRRNSLQIIRNTDDRWIPVSRDISRTVLWVCGLSSWLECLNVVFSAGTAWSAAEWPPVNCACVPQIFQQLINTTLCSAFLRKFVCQPLCCVSLQMQTFFYQNRLLVAEYHVDCWQALKWRVCDVTNFRCHKLSLIANVNN